MRTRASTRDLQVQVQQEKDRELVQACVNVDIDGVRRALDENANANIVVKADNTLLHYLAVFPGASAEIKIATEMITQLLLDRGALVNAQNNHGNTALHLNCINCNLPLSRLLLEHGAHPNIQNHYNTVGSSPMHAACLFGPLDLALLLVSFGGDIYSKNQDGQTALDACDAEDESSEIVKIDRQAVQLAFHHEQNWQRRKNFIFVLNQVYGSAAWQAAQQLLPAKEQTAHAVIDSDKPAAWGVYDEVFSIRGLRDSITSYL